MNEYISCYDPALDAFTYVSIRFYAHAVYDRVFVTEVKVLDRDVNEER